MAIEESDLEGALEFLRMAAEFDPARIEFEGPWISCAVSSSSTTAIALATLPGRRGSSLITPRSCASIYPRTLASCCRSSTEARPSTRSAPSVRCTFEALRILDRLPDTEIITVDS